MRIRRLLAVLGATTLLTALAAAPASAGTGASQWCGDGAGYLGLNVPGVPLTIGVEVSYAPGTHHQTILVCYGTAAPGQPNTGTGGVIVADVYTSTSAVYPGAYVGLSCIADYSTGFAPTCGLANSADFALNELVVQTPPSALCLVAEGTSCLVYVPGVKVVDGDPGRALLQLMVLGTRYDVDVPQNCLAVLVSCP